jgi:hypothetical protein
LAYLCPPLRLAQQVVKHVKYDTEYGFDLPCKEASLEVVPVTWTHGYQQIPGRMLPDNPQQMTLFVRAAKDASFGVGAAWKERNCWKTKAASLGKHLTEADAALFGISMHAQLGAADHQRHQEKSQASRRGRWSSSLNMAFEQQQLRGIRGCKRCGTTSSKTTAKSNAIGVTVVHEACREEKMETNNKTQ